MTVSKLNRYWTMAFILLIAITVIGGIVAWSRYSPSQPVEIYIPQGQEWQGEIYLDGAIANPGFYPFTDGESIEALIQAAGGTTGSANLSGLKLYIPGVGEEQEPQKVDINRAEVWLLKALPGIGKTLAQRIVDYRQQTGPFRNTNELLKVSGIGNATYEQIKDLVTVAD
ncbi:helix-hairpin-helix domain-containing protein [Chloroflexota bacterium]